jgi:Fic-DOC domain mobile mystery protein B
MGLWTPIPGETPVDDISGLKVKSITTRGALNIVEAENIRKAVVKYLAKRPSRRSARFDLAWALRLHKEMFGEVWQWAGKSRKSDKNLGIHWEHVEPALKSLLDDLAFWDSGQSIDLFEQSILLHHRSVAIHPFENGNGRWSRLLANVWLKLHGHAVTEWPETTVGKKSSIRAEYLAAVRLGDQGDYGPLRDLHRRFTTESAG